jgi:hypothetical protein
MCRPAIPPIDASAGDPDAPSGPTAITATVHSPQFVTREHVLAAAEMQISGEPLATAMGRDLAGYSRDALPADVYFEPDGFFWIDLAGFSTGVESYEYSKQPMNGLAFEFGAGTSLVFGRDVDRRDAGRLQLRDRRDLERIGGRARARRWLRVSRGE